ncbi:MAG TPA: TetR/AcrR family transcriptional regulator [Deltaproteobacteria bacterium]|mgnify:CR=1 FL=1|nr:TetR/AcrR family transcriptional regulator [Deltaproteobacteria bacterium]
MPEPRKRLPSVERKRQLVGLALELIASHGLQGASMARVARAAGISETALYRHFRSHRELILAALDETTAILQRYFDVHETDIKRRIHIVSANLYDGIMADSMESRLLFEFLRAPARENLQGPMQERFQASIKTLEDLLDKGIAAGQFRPDIDKTRIAWEIFAFGFTLNFVNILGFEKHLTKQRALTSLDEILDKISA